MLLGLAGASAGMPDYSAAHWDSAYPGHWNTGVSTRSFCTIHVTEGSYYGSISWFKNADAQGSSHYIVNSDYNSDGAPVGDITQMVQEKYGAWHARCCPA